MSNSPMIVGSTATTCVASTRAKGLMPYRFSAASLTTTLAAAPSQIPLALPADTVPFFLNTEGSLASDSRVDCGRGCSSCVNCSGSAPRLRAGTGTGVISALNAPASRAEQLCELQLQYSTNVTQITITHPPSNDAATAKHTRRTARE